MQIKTEYQNLRHGSDFLSLCFRHKFLMSLRIKYQK